MMRFVAAKIIAGEMTFYSPDPLRTLKGFQSLVGDFANVPDIKAMRKNNAALLQHFGALVRSENAQIVCNWTYFPDFIRVTDPLKELSGGAASNAWVRLELMMIVLGAGWVEGAGPRSKRLPCPPLCHYQ